VAHACNPSYSGGRNQEDHGLKLTQADSLTDPILTKPFTEKGWSGSRRRPSSNPTTAKKKKEEKEKRTNVKKADRVAQLVECLPSKHEA
jgi:hypothetical protein